MAEQRRRPGVVAANTTGPPRRSRSRGASPLLVTDGHTEATPDSVSSFLLEPSKVGIYLYWIPLGAGGSGFVQLNGRIYEAIKARIEQRRPLDLYHTALEVRLPEGRFVVETMWPSPGGDTASRGVVMEAPVFGRWIALLRLFRYEVRCWQDGLLPDADEAVGGPQLLSDDSDMARRLLHLTGSVPALIWGRDQLGTGDMWNSNSVISWLLTRSGLPINAIRPPAGGRAPGWEAGIVTALRQQQTEDRSISGTSILDPRHPRRAGDHPEPYVFRC